MIDGGVLSRRSSGPVSSGPRTMMAAEAMSVSVMQLPTTLARRSLSCAPKYWDTRMPAPVATPTNSASSRFRIGEALPTAASALSPTYMPTMTESAVLYICCARLPISIGRENSRIRRQGAPCDISCAEKSACRRLFSLAASMFRFLPGFFNTLPLGRFRPAASFLRRLS